jgi:hypothetical protein
MNGEAKAGIIGGTFLSILPSLTNEDLIKTVILAAIGAFVSFLVSHALKKLFQDKTN